MTNEVVFNNKAKEPNAKKLEEALGKNYALWRTILEHVSERHGPFEEEWKFYGANAGWQLKILLKQRNLCFFIPKEGYFRLIFVFGDKAVDAADRSTLPESLRKELREAKRYAEGRGLRLDVKDFIGVEIAKKLIDIKVAN